MAKGKRDGLLIAGGGLAGSLAALAMAKARPEVPLLLIEESDRFGGDHIWSWIEGEIPDEQRWLLETVGVQSWPGYYVSFPDFSRKLKIGYHCVGSEGLDRAVREALRPDQYRLNSKVVAVRDNEVVFPGGEKIRADGVIDARGAAHLSMLDLGWRKFVGRQYQFPKPHRVDMPVLIDATVDQIEGLHFFYCLPLSEDRLLIEDTYYSDGADLDVPALRERIDAYLALRGWRDGTLEREETGVLPVAVGDDLNAFWRSGGAQVAKLGLRGGFFNPLTGYALADAVHTAVLLSEQRDFSGPALHDLFEAEAEQLWRKRDYYRGFNANLFDASVWDRRALLAALYRQEMPAIARFYAGSLGVMDRRRISATKVAKQAR